MLSKLGVLAQRAENETVDMLVQRMFKAADLDGDGKITFDEFVYLFAQESQVHHHHHGPYTAHRD